MITIYLKYYDLSGILSSKVSFTVPLDPKGVPITERETGRMMSSHHYSRLTDVYDTWELNITALDGIITAKNLFIKNFYIGKGWQISFDNITYIPIILDNTGQLDIMGAEDNLNFPEYTLNIISIAPRTGAIT